MIIKEKDMRLVGICFMICFCMLSVSCSKSKNEINWDRLRSPTTSTHEGNKICVRVMDDYAIAYDHIRGRIVLFGGYNGGDLSNTTLEWDGTGWLQQYPGHSPIVRHGHAMVYDSNRQAVILFGGFTGPESPFASNDTWEWNGQDWDEKSSVNEPAIRYFHAMAYDSTRKVTVLFGGGASAYGILEDTWEWDGTDWKEIISSNRPSARWGHSMTYDTKRGVCVLFGGSDSYGRLFNDTWEWDGISWTQKSTRHKPPPRERHAMCYDTNRNVAVLFGGAKVEMRNAGGVRIGFNDTWEYNGLDWALRQSSDEDRRPAPRWGHAMVYDSRIKAVIVSAGSASNMWAGYIKEKIGTRTR